MLKFTDPTTKEVLTIESIKAGIAGNFDTALGKNPCARHYTCDEEKQQIWPLHFDVTLYGVIDTKKEGRLRVTARGAYKLDKAGTLRDIQGFSVSLTREATGDKMGGFQNHDRIAGLIRDHADQLTKGIQAALMGEIAKAQKTEETASSAHAARARVAKMIGAEVKRMGR